MHPAFSLSLSLIKLLSAYTIIELLGIFIAEQMCSNLHNMLSVQCFGLTYSTTMPNHSFLIYIITEYKYIYLTTRVHEFHTDSEKELSSFILLLFVSCSPRPGTNRTRHSIDVSANTDLNSVFPSYQH